MTVHRKTGACRACGGQDLGLVISFGDMPLANAFLASPAEFAGEPRYPLEVYFCRTCSLVQLADVIDPEVLFRNYLYVTGTSDTMARHNAGYAATVVDLLHAGARDLVVEVASNDGSLLQCFRKHGVRALGVEPAQNLAEQARANGIDTVDRFFNREAVRDLRAAYGPARAVIANNVLAHVDGTVDFLAGAHDWLADDGLFVVEVPYVRELLDRLEYDTIYHEHICYFSVIALMRLYGAAGLSIVRIDRVPVHGGSLRIYARRSATPDHAPSVQEMAAGERAAGLDSAAVYECFARKVEQNRSAVTSLLGELRARGNSLAAYGAPAKGNTLLNYCGIDHNWLPYTVDKNPRKVGLYTPGTHIPVQPVATLAEQRPDYTLLLAWNFAEEIMSQQSEYRRLGGRFIVPIPAPVVH